MSSPFAREDCVEKAARCLGKPAEPLGTQTTQFPTSSEPSASTSERSSPQRGRLAVAMGGPLPHAIRILIAPRRGRRHHPWSQNPGSPRRGAASTGCTRSEPDVCTACIRGLSSVGMLCPFPRHWERLRRHRGSKRALAADSKGASLSGLGKWKSGVRREGGPHMSVPGPHDARERPDAHAGREWPLDRQPLLLRPSKLPTRGGFSMPVLKPHVDPKTPKPQNPKTP